MHCEDDLPRAAVIDEKMQLGPKLTALADFQFTKNLAVAGRQLAELVIFLLRTEAAIAASA